MECIRSLQFVFEVVEEVIFVNDHSTDGSLEFIASQNLTKASLLSLNENVFGKKAALEMGIKAAKTEYIWSLDADVVIRHFSSVRFLEFERKLEQDLVILPVQMNSGSTLLEMLQANEWRYLQFITLFSSRVNRPMMCNGANLIFKRHLFLENIEAHRTISSGDDMFLLSQVMISGGDISVCWQEFGVVDIAPVFSLRDAINQRLRWAGKTTKLPYTRASVLHVLFAFLSIIHVLAFFGIFIPSWHLVSATFVVVKVIAELFFMHRIFSSRMKMKELILALPQMMLYPFFSLFIFISSLFFIPKWKGRSVSLK